MIHFTTDNMITPAFPFRAPTMTYIFQNVEPHHLQKLYQASKFFYAKIRLNIVKVLEFRDLDDEEEKFETDLVRIVDKGLDLKDLWITEKFIWWNYYGTEAIRLGRNLYDTVTHLSIKELSVGYILMEEFKFLVKSPCLQKVSVAHVFSKDADYEHPIEDIMAEIPQVSSIIFVRSRSTPETMTKLIALNRQTKITQFVLAENFGLFDAKLFAEFFKKHASPDIRYSLFVSDGLNAEEAALPEPFCYQKLFERVQQSYDELGKAIAPWDRI